MTEMNLFDAIKFVEESFPHLTDRQLQTFQTLVDFEIKARKKAGTYDPSKRIKELEKKVEEEKKPDEESPETS